VEKRRPVYALDDIKAAFGDSARLNRTSNSKQGADDLGMDDEAVVAVIQALTNSDFEKSMTSIANSKIWQDVYKPTTADGLTVYVKITLDERKELLLISFKEA
jgi:motility quorum-sensing regulator / GCU-specific mRNA interferase toxin